MTRGGIKVPLVLRTSTPQRPPKHGIPDGYLELDNYYDPPVSQKGVTQCSFFYSSLYSSIRRIHSVKIKCVVEDCQVIVHVVIFQKLVSL